MEDSLFTEKTLLRGQECMFGVMDGGLLAVKFVNINAFSDRSLVVNFTHKRGQQVMSKSTTRIPMYIGPRGQQSLLVEWEQC
ncbi:hypothetical protein XFUD_03930 [Xylella fastidiosa]|uniref:Uncharacterized protein n=1 Tax=Xylella fastidiosa (strain 9a5c) TaxID=160492 RepID=Q9PEW2_XYLFA|nr:hypothetical protein XF_0916 [Xylella fastidiosa 9a5c]ALQ94438.1 hypothetical protein XFUD_03930 [Xylella fastidiosa]OCA58418.1 hypothetical protein AA93_03895 [Xylella fastidiosa subsp. pauca 11399]ALR01995.1 hypothetical protein OY18_06865 [Xylella fastidiosa]ALR09464.2 hypothetical protein XFFB_09970 [Xylella fastidiosa]